MARVESLSMLLESSGKDFLAEEYGKVIENIQSTLISSMLKNTDLSGTPTAGSVEAKRFANALAQDYGTARAAGKGNGVTVRPVTVQIDKDKEIIEEVEEKDVALYGVEGTIRRRIAEHRQSLARELETTFFSTAGIAATSLTTTATAITDIAEAAIQQVESTKNDFVNGVPRDRIAIVCDSATYGGLRSAIDKEVYNANVNTAPAEFGDYHGVRVYKTIYLPTGTNMLCMIRGAIAEPVRASVAEPFFAQYSRAYVFGLFFYYGCVAVTPDLIVKVATATP